MNSLSAKASDLVSIFNSRTVSIHLLRVVPVVIILLLLFLSTAGGLQIVELVRILLRLDILQNPNQGKIAFFH